MAFETVVVRSTRNGITPVQGYREDLAVSDLVGLSLIDTSTGLPPVASSYLWEILGRPEGSSAGGPGPEPITLGIASTASFTVDTDAVFAKDGGYLVRCTLNGNSGSQTHINVLLIRLSGIFTSDGRDLRFLAAFEDLRNDTSILTILQGWATMANRWFRKVGELSGGGPIPPSATDRLQETLVNQAGVTLPLGTVVQMLGNSTIMDADARAAAAPRVIGVTGASILNTVAGLVRTHGLANVRLLGGESPAADDLLYLAATPVDSPPGPPWGYATTAKPGMFVSGEWAVPLGTVKDASPYGGVLGDLVVADLFIGQPSMQWEASGRRTDNGSILGIVVPTNSTALIELDLVGISDQHLGVADDCQFRFLIAVRNVTGTVTIRTVERLLQARTQVAFDGAFTTGAVGAGLGVLVATAGSGSAAHPMQWTAHARVTARRSATV